MSGDGSVFEALSAKLKQLANGAYFTVAELTARSFIVWTLSRDDNGTPEARRRAFTDVPEADPGALADFYASQLASLRDRDLLLIAHPSTYLEQLLALMLDKHRVSAYECQRPLEEHIRAAIMVTPLRVKYELVVLREEHDGRLKMDLVQLFPQDADHGYYSEALTIRCAPTDERGTAFAVVTHDRSGGGTQGNRRLRTIEIQSVKVPPGEYRISAELIRPGHVEFRGLPAQPGRDGRSLREIVQTVPDRLPEAHRAHLVCLLEVSGPEFLEHRIERLEDLINAAEASGRELKVSLVTYGPHSVQRLVPEEPATVLAWATPSDLAIRQLATLKKRAAPKNEYPRAAQVECALREVARMFAGKNPGRDGRPVLVTAGTRPPHPDKVDIYTEIIPCPDKVSWRRTLNSLYETFPDLRLGALCNVGARGNAWASLGKDAIEEVEVVDIPAFAAKLGISHSAQAVPFPLI